MINASSRFILHAGDKSKCKSFKFSTLIVNLFDFGQFTLLSREALMLLFN